MSEVKSYLLLNHGLGDCYIFYYVLRRFHHNHTFVPIVKSDIIGQHLKSSHLCEEYLVVPPLQKKFKSLYYFLKFIMSLRKNKVKSILVIYGNGFYWYLLLFLFFKHIYVHSFSSSRLLSRQLKLHKSDLIEKLLKKYFNKSPQLQVDSIHSQSRNIEKNVCLIFPSSGESYKTISTTVFYNILLGIVKIYPNLSLHLLAKSITPSELVFWENKSRSLKQLQINYESYQGEELDLLLKRFAFFLSGDNGLAHICSYNGIPGITLFGPTNYKWTGPLYPSHNFSLNFNCSPCQGFNRLKHCSGTRPCLNFNVDQICSLFFKLSPFNKN